MATMHVSMNGQAQNNPLRWIVYGFLMLALAGGPWLAMQSFAWARMLVVYSQQDGLVRGVTKTFDGLHPCSLCKSIARASAADRAKQTGNQKIAPTDSIWQAVMPENTAYRPALSVPRFSVWNETQDRLVHSPPTPPPRA